MGIRGLCSWIKWAAPTSVKEPNWQEWKGKTIGVDILGLLYNAKARKQCPFHYIAKLIASCKHNEINIVPIFDGRPPAEKSETIKIRSQIREESVAKLAVLEKDYEHTTMSDVQRAVLLENIQKLEKKGSYLTSEEREIAKQIFYACGIVPLNATGEADNVLAYFAKRGEFDAILSNDFDLLARGVETLLVPEFFALPGDSSGWAQYNLSSILQSVQFQYDQFLEMCVLMGSDYTTSKRILPYKSAFWAIKFGKSFQDALNKLDVPDTTAFHKAFEMLRGEEETKEKLMGDKQWEKMATYKPACEPEFLHLLRASLLKNISNEDFASLLTFSVTFKPPAPAL
jgi:flap endonuclease-1